MPVAHTRHYLSHPYSFLNEEVPFIGVPLNIFGLLVLGISHSLMKFIRIETRSGLSVAKRQLIEEVLLRIHRTLIVSAYFLKKKKIKIYCKFRTRIEMNLISYKWNGKYLEWGRGYLGLKMTRGGKVRVGFKYQQTLLYSMPPVLAKVILWWSC